MNPITLVVSIDTEEDQWAASRVPLSAENLRRAPHVYALLRRLGVRPTFFTSWAVASDAWAHGALKEIQQDGGAEIAAHLHPWNTPPTDEALGGANTMMKNLPYSLQERKLRHLTALITELRGSPPTSFRAGRWGLGASSLRALVEFGYHTDSSVMPSVDWSTTDDGPCFVGAPCHPYRLAPGSPVNEHVPGGPLCEVPVSVGFTRPPQWLWRRLQATVCDLRLQSRRLTGLLWRSRLLRRYALTPEERTVDEMLTLARMLVADGNRHLHMFWHSSSHMPGLTPFVRNESDAERFEGRIGEFVSALASEATLQFATVSEAAELHC